MAFAIRIDLLQTKLISDSGNELYIDMMEHEIQEIKTHCQIGSGCGEDQWLLCYIMMRRVLEVDTLEELKHAASSTTRTLPTCYIGFDYDETATEICRDILKPFEAIADIHQGDLFKIESYCNTLTAATTATVGPVFMVCGLLFVIGGGITEAFIFDGPGNFYHFKEMIKKHLVGQYGLLDYYQGRSSNVDIAKKTVKDALERTRAKEQSSLEHEDSDAFLDKFMESWICTDSSESEPFHADDKRDLWVVYIKRFVNWAFRYLRADGPLDTLACTNASYIEKQEYTMKLLRAYGRYICEREFRRVIDIVYIQKYFNTIRSVTRPLTLPASFDRFCFKDGQRPACDIKETLTSAELALAGYGEDGPHPLLIKEAYEDLNVPSNRVWRNPNAQKNAAAIFTNWFWYRLQLPWLIQERAGDFNRMKGEGWKESWIWPQSTTLDEKGVDTAIGKLFLPVGENYYHGEDDDDEVMDAQSTMNHGLAQEQDDPDNIATQSVPEVPETPTPSKRQRVHTQATEDEGLGLGIWTPRTESDLDNRPTDPQSFILRSRITNSNNNSNNNNSSSSSSSKRKR